MISHKFENNNALKLQLLSVYSIHFSTDTYNEKAIQDALQRLALRQQARQYSSINGSNVLRHELAGAGGGHPTGSNLNSKPPLAIMMRPASSGGRRDPYFHSSHAPPAMSISGQSIGGSHPHNSLHSQSFNKLGSQGDYLLLFRSCIFFLLLFLF